MGLTLGYGPYSFGTAFLMMKLDTKGYYIMLKTSLKSGQKIQLLQHYSSSSVSDFLFTLQQLLSGKPLVPLAKDLSGNPTQTSGALTGPICLLSGALFCTFQPLQLLQTLISASSLQWDHYAYFYSSCMYHR